MSKQAKPALIVHGGCGTYDIEEPLERDHQAAQSAGLERVISEGWRMLSAGSSAFDVAESVVNMLEDDPSFNAGIGAAIGSDKQIELDASIMDGSNLRCGAVCGLRNIPRAVSVARRVMEVTRHVFLGGEGANRFAEGQGFEHLPAERFYTDYQLYWWEKLAGGSRDRSAKGTVGAVALDAKGSIAAATSTGGMTRKLPGRIGDSPLIGAGCYADNQIGGASATGYGEQIIRVVLCKSALDLIEYKGLGAQAACEAGIAKLALLPDGLGGIIMIDRNGAIGAHSNERYLPRAYMSAAHSAPVVRFDFDPECVTK